MGKLAFGRFQTLFFPFSKISFAVLPHRWVTETAERQSSRQVPFISPDMLGAGFLLPGCLPMENFKAEVLFQYIHGVTEGITRSLHPQWQQYTAYTVLCLSAIPSEESTVSQIFHLLWVIWGFWCLAKLYQQCLWWLQEKDWEVSLCVINKIT